MKVTYPHMGYLSIPVFNMLTQLGIDVIEAPNNTQKTLELGSQNSPEGVCLPYKITMGNILEGIERGADTVITVCGPGKCRLGFYNAVQKIALDEKKPLDFFTINTDNMFFDLYHLLQNISQQRSGVEVVKNIVFGVKMLKALDDINNAKNFYGVRTKYPDNIISLFKSGSQQLAECHTLAEISNTRDMILTLIKTSAEFEEVNPVKIGVIGEFYLLLEPYVNHHIEDMLIKQGVEVKKFIYTGNWVYSQTFLRAIGLYNEEKAYLKEAQPYLNYHVGGDGLKSVGSALWCAKNKYDGVIHIYPFGCMPEVVAQYALKNIAQDYELPMLFLSIDEHASDVGLITRIEAFVDCVKRKRQKK